MITVLSGAISGLFHRLTLSPFIGQQRPVIQSIITPAAGVMVAFVSFMLTLSRSLKRTIPDNDKRGEVVSIVAQQWWKTFYPYGLVVAFTIAAGIGGVKK